MVGSRGQRWQGQLSHPLFVQPADSQDVLALAESDRSAGRVGRLPPCALAATASVTGSPPDWPAADTGARKAAARSTLRSKESDELWAKLSAPAYTARIRWGPAGREDSVSRPWPAGSSAEPPRTAP